MLEMSLAEGQQSTGEALTTQVIVEIERRSVLNSYWDNPTHKKPFGEEMDTLSIAEKMSSNIGAPSQRG
ncbi:hypothetical protein NPIL_555061, partial [Nephila pilipes]